ncbi:protein kinase [bacterium]|nr:protein kinase [bacterium]
MIGPTLSHYTILQKLGQGGMGEVYSAKDQKLERIVALKILPRELALDPDRMGRFIQEAKAASAINHPNVASIYELSNDGDVHFIAMELVEGVTLQDLIKQGALSHPEIFDIAFQAASALEEAHSKGVIHRDIKPVNMMVNQKGQLKILDFGLAKVLRQPQEGLLQPVIPQTQSGILLGTVQYLSPEQALGRSIDGRSDIFSLGTVLYQLATGRLPFQGQNAIEMIENILHVEPEPPTKVNREVSPMLEYITLKCLQKDPAARYQSAGELRAELKTVVQPSGTTKITFPGQKFQWKRKHTLFAAIAVLLIVAGFSLMRLITGKQDIRSIAVLPFTNMNDNPQMDYLSDGITESIINSLSQVPTLKVLARGTVFSYKRKEADPRDVGDDLNVDAVVTGSIQEHQENLVISVNLVNARDGAQMWGEQYNRQSKDILDVQSEISKEISYQLRFKLTGEQQQKVTRQFTANTDAYHLFLKGRYFLNKRSEEGFRRAIEHFELAIQKDPNYALAYAGLADCYTLMPAWALLTPSVGHSKARVAAQKAIELDGSLAEAYAALAHTNHNYDWDWPAAEKNYKRAIALNPNYAIAVHWYASFLSEMGRRDEAIPMKQRALDLDPLSLIINADLGFLLYQCRRFDDAIVQLKKTLELDPNFPITYQYLGFVYEQKSNEDAIIAFRKASTLMPDSPELKAQLAHALALSGNRSEALHLLEEVVGSSQAEYVSPFDVAMIYLGLGEKQKSIDWLEKALAERSYQMSSIKVEPRLDSLRSEPRFKKIMEAMKFPG